MRLRERLVKYRPSWRRHAWALLPILMIVGVDEAEMIFPRPIHIRPLLTVVPTLAAIFGGPLVTGALAVLALGDHLMLDSMQEDVSLINDELEITTLLLASGFVVGLAAVRSRHRTKLAQVRSVSEAAQRVVLRPLPPRVGPLRIASTYIAAAAEARIGGDLYAAARTGHSTRLIIGDVRGKGLTSISDAALLLCAFRESSRRHITLSRLVAHLENSFYRNLEEFAETDADADECFVTAAVVEVEDAEPVLRLLDRGHPPPVLLRDGRVTALHPAHIGPPLGLGDIAADGHEAGDDAGDGRVESTFPFGPGDILLLYTDGLLEARDRTGRFYPFAERVRAWRGNDPGALIRYLRDDLLAHVHQHLDDDAALVAIQRTPVPAAPRGAKAAETP